MDDAPLSPSDARTLRYLRGLVSLLTAVMVLGMITLVVVFVMRFPDGNAAAPGGLVPPHELALPPGATVAAVTRMPDAWVVVTVAGDIYFFAAGGGAPIRHIPPQK